MVRNDPSPDRAARGFSLLELLITLAVIAAMSSIMFPTFKRVRGMAQKLMCQNNMRSLYFALQTFEQERNGKPVSEHAPTQRNSKQSMRPQELMALSTDVDSKTGRASWDGLGKLWRGGSAHVGDASTFYCPAHRSRHTLSEYQEHFEPAAKKNAQRNPGIGRQLDKKVYSNYHYWHAWNAAVLARKKSQTERVEQSPFQDVLLTDGFRTKLDLNHDGGCNMLKEGGSIEWMGGRPYDRAIGNLNPRDAEKSPSQQMEDFSAIVKMLSPSAR